MAANSVIVKMRDSAIQRIVAVTNAFSQQLDIQTKEIPLFGRDLNYLQATQLEVIADNLEALHKTLAGEPEPESLESLTKAEIKARLDAADVEYNARADKSDLLSLLEAVESAANDDSTD